MAEVAEEVALTLEQVAKRLGVSYGTVFARREQIGFRLPGSRIWRVWPSSLASLGQRQYNVTRLTLRVGQENEQCQSAKIKTPAPGGLISASQAAKELGARLGRKTAKPRRNTTTD